MLFRSTAALCAAALLSVAAARAEDDVRRLIEESRKVSAQLLGGIRGELVKELESSGPLRAIIVCKYIAPEVASNVSRRTGWKVSRISLRTRNPALGAADQWEQRVLAEFDQRVAKGEKAEAVEHHEFVTEPTRSEEHTLNSSHT